MCYAIIYLVFLNKADFYESIHVIFLIEKQERIDRC